MLEGGCIVRFLLGKRPGEDTLFPRLFRELASRGITVDLVLPHEKGGAGVAGGQRPELAVQRGLRPEVMAELAGLEAIGWRFCNRVSASFAAIDRGRAMAALAAAGLAVPAAERVEDWAAAVAPGPHGAVVKAADGRIGRGAGVAFVAAGGWPARPPFPGPWIVEERIDGDGLDRKLYFAGRACRGLLKPWPREGAPARQFDPDPDLAALGHAAGRVLGLEVFGVDAVIGPRGPVIVDVNVFPGFRGVEGAAVLIADHLCGRLGGKK
jgi:ribosomal protein S6--L-glutamate ligase